jgi:replication factor C subunit 3/5
MGRELRRSAEGHRSLARKLTEQLRIDQRVFVTPSNRKLDVNVVQSNYHIELTPS